VIIDAPLDQAWSTLSHLRPVRGTIAGYTGTARLEVADDDTHTATWRLHGSGPEGTRTAIVVTRLETTESGTELSVDPQLPRAFIATLAVALVRPGPLSRLVRA
jgi:hypothetical protein